MEEFTNEQIIEAFNTRIRPLLDSGRFRIVGNTLEEGEYKTTSFLAPGTFGGSISTEVQWVPVKVSGAIPGMWGDFAIIR